mgnify:FL=1
MNNWQPIDTFGVGIFVGMFIGIAIGWFCTSLHYMDKLIRRYNLYDDDIRNKILDIVDGEE